MINFYYDLNYYIVAFVDILGFSEMVKSDCENRNGTLKYFKILKELNEHTKEISGCSITQFSDSIIFSLPLTFENYEKMLQILSVYQYELICNSIICRGAIAYGKHFMENEFMFSQALIEAYNLECTEAQYPRIIISHNLYDYFSAYSDKVNGILREKDSYYFVDYLSNGEKEKLYMILKKYSMNLGKYNMRIKEKYYWLFEYWEFIFKEKLPFASSRFE